MKHLRSHSKNLSVFLIFLIATVFLSSSVFVTDSPWTEQLPLPKWTHITFVAGGVQDPDANGKCLVGGEVVLYDPDNRIDLTATVQRYNSGWKDTSNSWSASDYGLATVAKRISLSDGLYRMKLVMKVYSPAGTLLESTVLYTGETLI